MIDPMDATIRDTLESLDDADHASYDRIWLATLARSTVAMRPTSDRWQGTGVRRRATRVPIVALVAAAAISLAATVGPTGWITSQFSVFEPSSAPDMSGARVVAQLQQHDGSALEIAEKVIRPTGGGAALRCVATRPAPPTDPVAAPLDPLSFGGAAFCSHLDAIQAESVWQPDGSAALLAHLPPGADHLELRAGNGSWPPTSLDESWAIFSVPAGSIPPGTPVTIFALGATGQTIAEERVH